MSKKSEKVLSPQEVEKLRLEAHLLDFIPAEYIKEFVQIYQNEYLLLASLIKLEGKLIYIIIRFI